MVEVAAVDVWPAATVDFRSSDIAIPSAAEAGAAIAGYSERFPAFSMRPGAGVAMEKVAEAVGVADNTSAEAT